MRNSAKAEAVLALHRFGTGPRPGSVTAIESDPRGALIAELDRPSAAVAASMLPSSAKAFRTVADANARRQAKAIVATKQEAAKRQQMADASVMTEGTTPGMSASAEKMAAEAVPDPGRPIYLQEAKVRTEAALSAIPSMLPADSDSRVKAIELIKQVLSARGELTADDKERMQRVVQLFGVEEKKGAARNFAVVPLAQKKGSAKAS